MERSAPRSASTAVVFGIAALLAGCSGISVNTDYDPLQAGTISSFQTYAWMEHPGGGDTRVNNELVAGRVMRAVEPHVPCVKIQSACFERYLWPGVEAYHRLIAEAKSLALQALG